MKKNIKRLFLSLAVLLVALVVTACDREEFTVSFDTLGGSHVESVTVLYDEAIDAPAAPTKEGHKFEGWTRTPNADSFYDFSTAIRENFTLYAKWSINSYNLTYWVGSGTLVDENKNPISTLKVEYGSKVSAPVNDPVLDGSDFEGWYTDSSYETPFDFEAFKTE